MLPYHVNYFFLVFFLSASNQSDQEANGRRDDGVVGGDDHEMAEDIQEEAPADGRRDDNGVGGAAPEIGMLIFCLGQCC